MNGWRYICTCCHQLCACVQYRVDGFRGASWWVHRSSCCRASLIAAYDE